MCGDVGLFARSKENYQLLIGTVDDVKDCIIEISDNLSMIPANDDLAGAEIELIGIEKNGSKLRLDWTM